MLVVKNPPVNAGEAFPDPLDQENPLEEGMTTHSSILSWRTPWTEFRGRLWFIGSQRVRHD